MPRAKAKKKTSPPSLIHNSDHLFLLILAAATLIVGIFSMRLTYRPKVAYVAQPENKIIEVDSQTAGSQVTIKSVEVAKPGFVLIRLEEEKGELGKVIGVSKYLDKDTENLTINLYQATTSQQTLTAELRIDDDNNKRFNVQKDSEAKDSKGERISTTLNVK